MCTWLVARAGDAYPELAFDLDNLDPISENPLAWYEHVYQTGLPVQDKGGGSGFPHLDREYQSISSITVSVQASSILSPPRLSGALPCLGAASRNSPYKVSQTENGQNGSL